ncbi:MAG TPA: GtrA family protein [Candidatus Paceibacterota bacterium]|jgi:putative flippase GtrA|nr:GtrA family protein [Candidatus Paceibacterota bacterium]
MKPSVKRFLQYSAVGLFTLIFDLLILYGATTLLSIPLYISTPVAFLVAITINYFIIRRYVFKGTERAVHHGYALFAASAGAGALITTVGVVLLVSYAHLYYLIARLLIGVFTGVANYFFNLYLNFRVAGHHP